MRRLSGPSAFFASTASLPRKPPGFFRSTREAEAGLEDRVGVVDVVTVVAIALLHAQARERLEARMTSPKRSPASTRRS